MNRGGADAFCRGGKESLLTSCWYNMCAAILHPALSRANAVYPTFVCVGLLTNNASGKKILFSGADFSLVAGIAFP